MIITNKIKVIAQKMSKSKNSHKYKDKNKFFWGDISTISDSICSANYLRIHFLVSTPRLWCNFWCVKLRAFKWDNLVTLRDGLRMLGAEGCLSV